MTTDGFMMPICISMGKIAAAAPVPSGFRTGR
jgi:hypothetical protein